MTPSFSQKGLDWARIICERGLNWGKNGPKIGVNFFFVCKQTADFNHLNCLL